MMTYLIGPAHTKYVRVRISTGIRHTHDGCTVEILFRLHDSQKKFRRENVKLRAPS